MTNPLTEVETDAHGIRPDVLRNIMESWPEAKPKPKVLYTVPVRHFNQVLARNLNTFIQYGTNPTGATATLVRRLEVLTLAREHEFFILEGCT